MVIAPPIKKGYKQTELGVIPEDWDVHTVSECSQRITDGEHLTPQRTSSGYYLLSARNILNGRIDTTDVDYVGHAEYRRIRLRCNPEFEDVLISCSGTIGRVAIVPPKFECVMVRSAALVKPNRAKAIGPYMQYFLQSAVGQRQIFSSLNQGAQANLFLNHIHALRIVLPPTTTEQTAIAEVLSDTDALLEKLEELITKKKAIKQGTMQQLLNGKKRLSGFDKKKGYKQTALGVIPEDWEVKSFHEIVAKFIDYRGVTPRKLGMEWGGGDICALSANNVQMGYIDFQKECYLASEQLYKRWMRNGDCSKGDILLTMEAPLGNIAFIPDHKKYVLSQRTILIKPLEKIIEKDYLRYFMMDAPFQRRLSDNASGSTAQGIQRKRLEKISICFPKNKSEQTAIASVLSDMDEEIERLEQKRDKYTLLKQGMMQQLLTGRIRLL